MRNLSLCLTVILAAGCSKTPSYELYRDPSGFSLDAPKGWPVDADPAAAGKRFSQTKFIGDAQPQQEGEILGAVLTVTRWSRKPGSPALAAPKSLFPDDAATSAISKPFARDYEYGGPTPLHQSAVAVQMHEEGKIFRTADAFFVVQLKAAREKFEKNRHALERALATFRPN